MSKVKVQFLTPNFFITALICSRIRVTPQIVIYLIALLQKLSIFVKIWILRGLQKSKKHETIRPFANEATLFAGKQCFLTF